MKDVQNQIDARGVDIQKVGIKGLELPLIIQRKDKEDIVIYSSATAGVSLPAHYKGTHMSRFVEVLNEWRSNNTLGVDIKGCVEEIIRRLNAKSGYVLRNCVMRCNCLSPIIIFPRSSSCLDIGIFCNCNSDKYSFTLRAASRIITQ